MEEQRYGRDKSTLINHTYINSGTYKRKFDLIANDKELSRLLYKVAKQMLEHRSGSKFEDMYWIDLDTLQIVAKEVNCPVEKRIIYSSETEKVIRIYENLLTMHSHPNSFPPSIDDLNSNFERDYRIGLIICHNGKIYMYSANEWINEKYYKLVVEGYLKQGYNENRSQILALSELQEHFDISFKEVTDYGDV